MASNLQDLAGDPPIVLIMGPTAAGKSALALALASQLPAEIVSVDSAQVYRGMDIGTAKPDAATRARVPHHLIDILDPAQPYSAGRFREDAARAIAGIRARGRVPLLVGGTMLYFRALTRGLSDLPRADAEVRARIAREALVRGWPALYAQLARADPAAASRIHPNDAQRIQRALEILEITGEPPSNRHARAATVRPLAPMIRIAAAPDGRAELHRRIRCRFEQMMRTGFLEEVERLRARGDLHPELPSMRAVGYRQLWAHLDGAFALEEAVTRAVFATRQFAKRQLTWLRTEPDLTWLDPCSPCAAGRALARIRRSS